MIDKRPDGSSRSYLKTAISFKIGDELPLLQHHMPMVI